MFFVAWMETVMTKILETSSLLQAWLMPHLIANSSASKLVMNAAWWTVFMEGGWLDECAKWM